jgi:hypothetical protein
MLTATELSFVKELIEQLAELADPSEYTQNEVSLALELLNRIEPLETNAVLDLLDSIEELEER